MRKITKSDHIRWEPEALEKYFLIIIIQTTIDKIVAVISDTA